MKCPALFSLQDKSKKLKCRLLQLLFVGLKGEAYCSAVQIRRGNRDNSVIIFSILPYKHML